MNISRSLAKKPELSPLLWLVLAAIAGFAASQSWSAGILVFTIWAVLLAITPLTAFFALLVLAPMRTLIETEAPVRLPLDIGQITVLVLAGAWIIYRIARHKPLIKLVWSPVYIPLIGFLIAVTATAFSSISMGAWLNEWLKWVMIAALVVLVLDFRHWEWLVGGLILAAAGNALVGVYIFLGGSGALHLLINDRFFRAFGTFGQPNPFGGFMGLIAPLAIAATLGQAWQLWQQYLHRRNVSAQQVLIMLVYALAAGLICLGVVISWSRGAWLGFGLSMLVFVIAIPRRWRHSTLILVIVISVVGLLWASGRLPATIVDRINSATAEIFAFNDVRGVDITPENFAVVERLAHWQAALDMARSNWWLGVGFGNYEIAYENYRLIGWKISLGHAHNYYLNVLAETGIIGLSAYLTLWSGVFWLTLRARNHPDMPARLIAVGLLGTWTYLAIHSLTDNLYVNNLFLHLGIMLGITALLYNQTYRHSKIRML